MKCQARQYSKFPSPITLFRTLFLITLLVSYTDSFAQAGESLFGRAYTTETVPQGHFEIEQLIRHRSHRSFGQYAADDFKTEFEYGLTDSAQLAFYVNTEYLSAQNAPDDNDPDGRRGPGEGFTRSKYFLQSVAAELVYRMLSPVTDPVGLAFYFEPQIDFHDMHNGDRTYGSIENEFRILVQKNFFEDQLILVYNLVLEVEYFRYADRETLWQGELDWNNEFGASYRVAPNWYAGIEARNHNEAGNFWSHDHSVYWAGPTLHYGGPKLWATLGVMRELYGLPSGPDEKGSDQGPSGLFLHSHELWETTLKVAIPF